MRDGRLTTSSRKGIRRVENKERGSGYREPGRREEIENWGGGVFSMHGQAAPSA